MARLLVAEKYDCNYYLNLDTIEILTGRLVQIIVFFKNNSYFPFEKDIEKYPIQIRLRNWFKLVSFFTIKIDADNLVDVINNKKNI